MTPKKHSTLPTPQERARTKRLRVLMEQHELTAEQVGDIIGVKANTVAVYRCRDSGTVISERALRLIELEMADRARQAEAAE